MDAGGSRDEVAVFYRANAQSRVLEDTLVRYGVGYQVIGGTSFYERAEIKDALGYLTFLVNPHDVVAFQRIVNSPRRGIGDTTQARIGGHANTIGEPDLGRGVAPRGHPRAGRGRHQGRRPLHVGDGAPARACRRRGARRRPARGDAHRGRLHGRAQGGAHDRGRGPAREPRGARQRRARVRRPGRGAVRRGVPPAGRALLRAGQPHGRGGHRHADDAAQREGPRVPGRVHDRDGGRRLPAHALDRGGRHRGGAAALLRRDHPRDAQALSHARAHARDVRRARVERAQPLPG